MPRSVLPYRRRSPPRSVYKNDKVLANYIDNEFLSVESITDDLAATIQQNIQEVIEANSVWQDAIADALEPLEATITSMQEDIEDLQAAVLALGGDPGGDIADSFYSSTTETVTTRTFYPEYFDFEAEFPSTGYWHVTTALKATAEEASPGTWTAKVLVRFGGNLVEHRVTGSSQIINVSVTDVRNASDGGDVEVRVEPTRSGLNLTATFSDLVISGVRYE